MSLSLPAFRIALQDLSVEQLEQTREQLVLLVQKLQELNEILKQELDALALAPDKESHDVYADAVQENLEVLERQEERIRSVDSECQRRGVPQGVALQDAPPASSLDEGTPGSLVYL